MIKTKRAILVANGNLQFSEQLRQTHTAGDLLIGVDAGARHCLVLNLIPDLVVGDFDSLGADTLTALQEKGVQLVRYPSRKDETDLELAIGHAREAGATEILIFGALGARWDMTLANLLLLSHPSTRRMKVRLFDGSQEITTIHSGESLRISGRPGDTVSLIPLKEDANGITTQGLEYPLTDGSLSYGSPRGVSNTLLETSATVKLRKGLLLCTIIHHAGFAGSIE